MAVSRKEFLKKACLSGACICGVGSLVMAQSQAGVTPQQDQETKNPNALQQEWVSILLSNIDDRLSEEELRAMLKGCAIAHYNSLDMDSILAPFKGKTDEFLKFLTNEWGWKIDYDKSTGIIICDENKNYCVCPMVNKAKGIASSAICYCSEGFTSKMFTVIAGAPAKATVLKSIYRGDPSCVYKVELS